MNQILLLGPLQEPTSAQRTPKTLAIYNSLPPFCRSLSLPSSSSSCASSLSLRLGLLFFIFCYPFNFHPVSSQQYLTTTTSPA